MTSADSVHAPASDHPPTTRGFFRALLRRMRHHPRRVPHSACNPGRPAPASCRDMPPFFERTIVIHASPATVWECLVQTGHMKQWMGEPEMALDIETDWTVGGSIVIRGLHHERFVNTGTVLAFEPVQTLCYSHLSSLSRLPDVAENHATLTFSLQALDNAMSLHLKVSGFATPTIFQHLQFYWNGTLPLLKQYAERQR
jgi:uncharacterized protein YndB with AHSA1/START domain